VLSDAEHIGLATGWRSGGARHHGNLESPVYFSAHPKEEQDPQFFGDPVPPFSFGGSNWDCGPGDPNYREVGTGFEEMLEDIGENYIGNPGLEIGLDGMDEDDMFIEETSPDDKWKLEFDVNSFGIVSGQTVYNDYPRLNKSFSGTWEKDGEINLVCDYCDGSQSEFVGKYENTNIIKINVEVKKVGTEQHITNWVVGNKGSGEGKWSMEPII